MIFYEESKKSKNRNLKMFFFRWRGGLGLVVSDFFYKE